jgi:AraC-like DNA-binding protein
MLPLIRYKNQLLTWIGIRPRQQAHFPGSEYHETVHKDLQLQQHSYRGHLFKILSRLFRSEKKYKLTVEETLSTEGMQLSAVLQGQLIRNNQHKQENLNAGHYEISHPKTLQEAFQPGTACHFFVVHYSDALLEELGVRTRLQQTIPRPLTDDMNAVIQKTLRYAHDEDLQQMHYQNCIRELLFLHLSQKEASLPGQLPKDKLAAIISADNYLQQTLQLPGTVAKLARKYNMSESGLQKGFRTRFSMPVGRRLTFHRIQLAMKLLRSTTRTIEDIAFETGYGSRNSFISAFKNAEKISPNAWRQQNS